MSSEMPNSQQTASQPDRPTQEQPEPTYQLEGRPENLEFSRKHNKIKITVETPDTHLQKGGKQVIYAAAYLLLADVVLVEKEPEDPKNPGLAIDTDVATTYTNRAQMVDLMEKVKHTMYREKVEEVG